ncbi:MAG: DNA polymerase III subunit [Planctomycetaceae bacterium]|nr:DNA polymerase III subunit [Planctomycetaceae bacterium]
MPIISDNILDPAIAGHERQQQDLLHALRTSRLGHAYLFSGQSGIGKRLVALALAKALVCEQPDDRAPCLRCRQCKMVESGVHPDVQVFSRDKSVYSAEYMRESVLDWAARTPREGKAKAGILLDVEFLANASANVFLKTLEEPPAGTYWFLLSGRSGHVLPTIRSRCLDVRFAPLKRDDVERLVRGPLKGAVETIASEREESSLGTDEREFLLDFAEGSPGRYMSLLREDMFAAFEIVRGAASAKPTPFDASEKILAHLSRAEDTTQEPLRERLHLLIDLLERDAHARDGGGSSDHFRKLHGSLDANANPKLVADMLVLHHCVMPREQQT